MRKTLSCINVSDVMTHIGVPSHLYDPVLTLSFDSVAYGNSAYTLIGNNFALSCILQALDYYGLVTSAEDSERYERLFWEIVDDEDYINLEN